MSSIWIAVIGSSITAFLNKYIGHSVPEKWLNQPIFIRINALVPIVLLSALVGVQTFTSKKELVIDQRAAGVFVALVALKFKAPFPLVVISAAITSAVSGTPITFCARATRKRTSARLGKLIT
ncbi:MAG: AzlD domain-containing protein [Actinobacteria bacterium]|nr:AzlD domain-containing protein [Actinomycetota bacterium]